METKKYALYIAIALLITGGLISSGKLGVSWSSLSKQLGVKNTQSFEQMQSETRTTEKVKVSVEESVVIDVVDKVSPSVVTIGITKTGRINNFFEFDPFDPYSPFRQRQGTTKKVEQDIGSGFIVKSDGLIVTNKHVVSDTEAKYRVITKDDKTFDVQKIYRDPTNDLAILKINATGLPEAELGDSGKIKVGQLAIAIGTALGEFRHTVTTGVISGVGRGITAGSPFAGDSERLDNVLQTDAAINPGNSGGPLLNSGGQVIGVNTAVSSEGQNIGFALPINVIKDAIDNFNTTGQFDRPFLGVRYRVVSKDVAILNEVPEGVYIMEVVSGSPADKGGVTEGDIITKIDGTRLSGENVELSKVISKKKVGDTITLNIWREEKDVEVKVTLASQE